MKLIKTTFAIFATLTLFGCNNDEKQIIKVAEGYLDAMGNYRIEDAYQYATKTTRETTLPYLSETLIPMTDSTFLAANVPAEIELDSLLVVGDTAWVLYTKTTPLKRYQNTIYLIKEEGKWLVDVPLAIPETFTITPNGITTDTVGRALTEMQKLSKAE